MDNIIQIILVIAGCIAGLGALWFLIMLAFAAIAKAQFKKASARMDAEREAWRKRHGFR